MNNFEFCNPVKVVFGKGSIARLSALIPEGSKVLMVYGGGSIKKNGIYGQVTKALEGFEVTEVHRGVCRFRRRSVGYSFERWRDKECPAFGYGTYIGRDRFGDERTFGHLPCIDL